jgi:uncharacterized membrane protein
VSSRVIDAGMHAGNLVRFLLLILLALLAGAMFGIWVGYNPAGLSAATFVEQQQNAIRGLNTLLPIMGGVCTVLTVTLALLTRTNPGSRYLLSAAAVLLLVAGAITRLGNQPINAVVMQWSPQSPAANWAALRDQWWQWHIVRSLAAIGALVLVVLATIFTSPQRSRSP